MGEGVVGVNAVSQLSVDPATQVLPVILAGGAGTRLWPVSRADVPKPFMKLGGQYSLLANTYARALALPNVVARHDSSPLILTVTQERYHALCQEELRALAHPAPADAVFLLEPMARNTAPAIVLAALWASQFISPKVNLLIMPADHWIANPQAFANTVTDALELAQEGYVVTFGIQPTHPETGYGYIVPSTTVLGKRDCGYLIGSFEEKPTSARAKALCEAGALWNAGIFCFGAEAFLNTVATLAPDFDEAIRRIWQGANVTDTKANANMMQFSATSFKDLPDQSIDYAVMEHLQNGAVVPARFGWSDVGSWAALRDLPTEQIQAHAKPDALDPILIDCEGVFVHTQSEPRVVAGIGLNNLVIVDTPDALLVAAGDRTQEVKAILTTMKERGIEMDSHATVARPWGTYTVLEEGPGFKIKKIMVRPGASLSLQLHHHRSEHWVVVTGVATVVNGEQTLTIEKNQSTYIPAGCRHRLSNQTAKPLIMIEVQCGSYLGEDDIVRFDDQYGRHQSA